MRPPAAESILQGGNQEIHRQSANCDHHIGLAEIVLRRGSEPPLLQHRKEDVAIYVLSGRLTIVVNEISHKSARGSHIFVPRDCTYGFAIRSSAAHLLMIVTPGGAEDWYSELQSALVPQASPAAGEGSWGMEQLVSIAARYDIDIVGPPPNVGSIERTPERPSFEPLPAGA